MNHSNRLAIAVSLLVLILLPLVVEGMPPTLLLDRVRTFVTIFLGIFIEAVPFLLAGTLASGLIEVFSREWVLGLSPRSTLIGALVGALLGLVFPVCECGVVPLTRRLLRKGLPLPAAIAYLLAAPVMNPIVIAGTWAAFGVGRILAILPLQEENNAQKNLHRRLDRKRTCIFAGFHQERQTFCA